MLCLHMSAGMPMGSHKKSGTTFGGKPACVYVAHVHCIKEAKKEAPKRVRERNMPLFIVRNYLLGFRRISGVDILVQKNVDFCGSEEDWHP